MLALFDPEKHYSERNLDRIGELVATYMEAGIPAETILREGLLKGMGFIAEKFKLGEVFLPDIWIASRAVKRGMKILAPKLIRSSLGKKGKIVIGTVEGDIHDIGKNLVIVMLEGAGFEVKDLGVNVPAGRFLSAVQESKPHILGLSAMLSTTMRNMKEVIKSVEKERYLNNLKVIVGGALVHQEFARSIEADAYACDCVEALEKCLDIRKQQIGAHLESILESLFSG
nr:cobalamin-binding protein [Desulfobacterales bacterium]